MAESKQTSQETHEETETPTGWRHWLSKSWCEWVKPILVVVLIVGSFRSAVADWNDVPTGSMKPTILEGDRIFVNKIAYDLKVPFTRLRLAQWSGPERGDVVVFFPPGIDTLYVKRVVAVPGDTVELRDNQLFINNEPAEYKPLDEAVKNEIAEDQRGWHHFATERVFGKEHPVMTTPGIPSESSFSLIEIPEGSYFMMGDNRDRSSDSRVFGLVPRERILGQAIGIAISVNPQRRFSPRWHRFFKALQ